MKSYVLRTSLLAITLILITVSSFGADVLGADGGMILPSFTVDETQGQLGTGFIVTCTNTTSNTDPDCAATLIYTWSVDNGVQGVDWDFLSDENSTDMMIGFFTAGCYDIHLNVIECVTSIGANPTSIIVSGTPEINIPSASSLDICGGNSVNIDWEIASNNNQSVDVEILVDGVSVSSSTYSPATICLPIGNIDITDTFTVSDLSVGTHVFELIATGGFNSSSISHLENFEVFDNPTFTIEGLNEICEGECIDLQVNWIDPPTSSVSLDWTLDTAPHSTGESFNYCPTYTSGTAVIGLTVNADNSCSSSTAISVTTTPIPVTSITISDIEGCAPLTVNFLADVDFAAVTAWAFGNGQNDSGNLSTQTTFDCEDYNSGDCLFDVSFTAISASNPNCLSTNTETITLHPQPLADFNLSSEGICFDMGSDADIIINNTSSNIIGLNCSGGIEPYAWTVFPTGVNDCTEFSTDVPNLFAAGTGVFTIGLVATDAFGCSSQTFKDFDVFSNPVPEITFLQNTICLPLEVEILNTSTGASTFNLEVPGFVIPDNFSSPFVIEAEYPGVYEAELTITSDEGCTVALDIDNAFQAWYPPVADFLVTPEEILFLDPIVTFENMSNGGTEYIWSFGDGTGASEVNPEHEYERADSYEVQLHVTNIHGCTDIATQTIHVTNELQIFVPNAFTPDNDGNNDSWAPVINGEELILSYECWVYDRWGKLVFNSTTIGEPWIGDNTVDGAGTHYVSATEQFSWKIEVKKVNGLGANISTGTVFLVR
jgi:gliding motility-associated-like protein